MRSIALLIQTKQWDSGESWNLLHMQIMLAGVFFQSIHNFHWNIKGINDAKEDENKNSYENQKKKH